MSDVILPPALLVQVEENYGTYRAVARPVIPQENGELFTPSWSSRYVSSCGLEGARLDGLEISAYAGNSSWSAVQSDEYNRLWGFGAHFAPHRIDDAKHAQAIAKVMGQLERGMAKLEIEDGYIRDGEFARYVMRAAKALKIRKIYTRTLPGQYRVSGERYRLTDAVQLDYWTQEVTAKIVAGELSTLVRN